MAVSSDAATNVNELLATKLFPLRWRDGMISRPRLLDQLTRAREGKLTLISAPAGFGKSTLVAEWIATERPDSCDVGWVSLDHSDNDAGSFWNYVLAALGAIDPALGARARSMLNASTSPVVEAILTSAINDISGYAGDITLVLDDFHVIEAQSILQAAEFLIMNLPPNMHIVIASRSDPRLPLARLRGGGEAVELRAADLRFTAEETAAFLNDTMDLDLSEVDVSALDARTEGWITGLQLAALSLRGRDSASDFIRAFAGDDRYIVDYLVEEVLNRQPADVRSFLLRTSILDRLCGELCDALDGASGGQDMLERLERDNILLAPLDDKRRWYRYHHLFADVLRAHVTEEFPEEIVAWHRQASDWYARHDLHADALRHALASGDLDHAANLIELAWRPMDRNRQGSTWLTWVRQLPEEKIEARPVLCVANAWALLEAGELQAGRDWLALADAHLSDLRQPTEAGPTMHIADENEYQHLAASIAGARAFHAMALNETDEAAVQARRALQLLPDHEHERRSAPAALLALAAWTRGDLDEAARSLRDSLASARMLDNARFVINGSYVLGEVLRGQGSLDAAFEVYEQALHSTASQTDVLAASAADLYTGTAELHILRNDLDAADAALARSRELAEEAGLPHWRHRWLVACAGLRDARGDSDGALDALDEAAACYIRGPVPEVRPIDAFLARILIRSGRLDDANRRISDLPELSDGTPGYLLEYGRLTLARLIVARRHERGSDQFRRELFDLLDRLLEAARSQRRIASQIEILALKALALDAYGSSPAAFAPLNEALDLAEPIGLLRVFLAEGEPMLALLRAGVATGEASGLVARLVPAFVLAPDATAQSVGGAGDGLVEPLTERERDVLRLIAIGMRNREIADELYISLSTVKRHIANAYGKLGVHNRTEAVARANELNLL